MPKISKIKLEIPSYFKSDFRSRSYTGLVRGFGDRIARLA